MSFEKLDSELADEVIIYTVEDLKKIGINWMLVARYLEWIADHAYNISERTEYMVTGERVVKD